MWDDSPKQRCSALRSTKELLVTKIEKFLLTIKSDLRLKCYFKNFTNTIALFLSDYIIGIITCLYSVTAVNFKKRPKNELITLSNTIFVLGC